MPRASAVQIDFEKFRVHDAVCILGLRMRDLADRLGWAVETWDEDGLGEAVGVCARLSSGRVLQIYELTDAVEHMGVPGPAVYVEGIDFASREQIEPIDYDSIRAEALDGLGLTEADVAWRQGEDWKTPAAA